MLDLVSDLLSLGRAEYVFKKRKRADGSAISVPIERVSLLDLAIHKMIPYALLEGAAEKSKGALDAREAAIRKAKSRAAETEVGGASPTDIQAQETVEMYRAFAQIINAGCPSLRGRVYVLDSDVPRNVEGQKLGVSIGDLGEADFVGLAEAILALNSEEGASEKAARFPETEQRA